MNQEHLTPMMKKFFTIFLVAIFFAGGVCSVFGEQAYAMDIESQDIVVHHNSSSTDIPNKVECCDCNELGGTEMKCCYQNGNNSIASHSTDHQSRKTKFKSKIFVSLPTGLPQVHHKTSPKIIPLSKANYLPKRVIQRIVRLE